jgi:hypothetical protein
VEQRIRFGAHWGCVAPPIIDAATAELPLFVSDDHPALGERR